MESINRIREILDRFYLGESSLEEERELERFFDSERVPGDLLPDRDLFRSLGASGKIADIPSDLNSRILSSIDSEELKAVKTRRISAFSLSGLAAGLLAVIAIYVLFLKNENVKTAGTFPDTYKDPMEAYQKTKETLAYVSSKLNEGTGELKHVQELSRSATEPLQSLSRINKGSKEISLLGQLQRVRDIEQN